MNTAGAAETDTEAAAVANTSGITAQSLTATLREKLEASHVDINDISGIYIAVYWNITVRDADWHSA